MREGKCSEVSAQHVFYKTKSKPIYRCEPDREVNFSDCLSDYIEGQVGCRLPWRKPKDKSASYCQHLEEIEKYENISTHLASLGDSLIVDLTQCQMSCSQTKYTSRQVSLSSRNFQITITIKIFSYFSLFTVSPNSSLVSSTEERNTKSEFHKDNKIQLTWQYGQGDYEEKKEVCLLLHMFVYFYKT